MNNSHSLLIVTGSLLRATSNITVRDCTLITKSRHLQHLYSRRKKNQKFGEFAKHGFWSTISPRMNYKRDSILTAIAKYSQKIWYTITYYWPHRVVNVFHPALNRTHQQTFYPSNDMNSLKNSFGIGRLFLII